MMTFGQRVKALREKQGLSQSELARKMNISQQAIAKYEKTVEQPKMTTVKRLADALNCDIYGLIDGGFGALDPVLPSNMQGVNLDGAKVDKSFLDYLLSRLSSLDASSPEYRRAKDNIIALAASSNLGEYADSVLQQTREKEYPLLQSFYKLNGAGQNKAIEQVELLTKIPEYQKKEE